MTKIIFHKYLIGFLFCIALFSCTKRQDSSLLIDSYIDLVNHYTDKESLVAAYDSIAKELPTTSAAILQAVYKVRLGQLYAEEIDAENKSSKEYFSDAISSAKATRNIALQIWTNTQVGFYYYTYSQYVEALPYFLESSRELKSYPWTKIPKGNDVLIKHAYFFGTIEQNEKSIEYLKKAISLSPKNSPIYNSALYALAAIYLKIQDYDEAETYLNKTTQASLEGHDSLRYAKTLGELAFLKDLQGKTNEAIALLKEDIEISKRHGNKRNLTYAQLQLGKLYHKYENYSNALEILNVAQDYASEKVYLKGFEKEILKLKLDIARKENNYLHELQLRRKLDTLNLFLSFTDGEEVVNKVNWQSQQERILWQLEAEQSKLENAQFLKWAWATLSTLLIVIVLLVLLYHKKQINFLKLKYDRKLIGFKLEKVNSERKLKEANNTLSSYLVYLDEKNQQIKQLENEISTINKNAKNRLKEQRTSLESMLSSHLMTEENWLLFKHAFIGEQQEFYYKIIQTLPGITESNLRIILLQSLGLNNHEAANLLGVTSGAVKKSKQRLRKKYGDLYENIDTILQVQQNY